MQLTELKKQMKFNVELLSLISTLKNIASSKYHSLEREKERFGEYMDAFSDFFRVVHLADVDDPLVRSVTDIVGIVMVTSDSGFMGGLNSGIIEAAMKVQGDRPDDKVHLVVIGEKGAGRISDAKRSFKFFQGISEDTCYEQALEMTDYLVKETLEKRIGSVVLAYPKPVSFTRQTIETINILPCANLFDRSAHSEMAAKAGGKRLIAEATRVIVESSFSDMVEYLARTWVAAKLYEVFEDSKLSEFSARAMHLEGSNQKLEKEHKKMQYKYFRATHEKIDKGMRESFSAGNIRKKKRQAEAKEEAALSAAREGA